MAQDGGKKHALTKDQRKAIGAALRKDDASRLVFVNGELAKRGQPELADVSALRSWESDGLSKVRAEFVAKLGEARLVGIESGEDDEEAINLWCHLCCLQFGGWLCTVVCEYGGMIGSKCECQPAEPVGPPR